MIGLTLKGHNYDYEIKMLIKAFLPLEDIVLSDNENIVIETIIDGDEYTCNIYQASSKVAYYTEKNKEYIDKKKAKRLLKLVVYKALETFTGKILPWGILTGIRPTKIVFELFDEGFTEEQIKTILKNEYCIEDDKINLMLQITKTERDILIKNKDEEYNLYIGIPFCPTKCLYCSFTSYSSEKYATELDDYVAAVIKEMREVKEIMQDRPIRSVYIGGGTPTSLNAYQLDKLIKELTMTFDLTEVDEFTVEAGRPDSITKDKLLVLKKYNVDRISINPQTMNQETLDLIGRKHTVQDIIDCFNMARDLGFNNINMDIILGLPEEKPHHVKNTMDELIKLKPESITVHTMAVKRGSKLRQLPLEEIMSQVEAVEEMLNIANDGANQLGLKPYYMYRQKNMIGNFENVGYALEGKESIYNIEIMEEKETIIALGAGAITKVVFPAENRIERIENVKNVEQYINRIDEMIDRKKKFFICN